VNVAVRFISNRRASFIASRGLSLMGVLEIVEILQPAAAQGDEGQQQQNVRETPH
jgi:hypothetical protein